MVLFAFLRKRVASSVLIGAVFRFFKHNWMVEVAVWVFGGGGGMRGRRPSQY